MIHFVVVVVAIVKEIVNAIVKGGVVPALIKHLQSPAENNYVQKSLPFVHEVEKGSSFTLGVLAVKVTSLPPFLYSIIVQIC